MSLSRPRSMEANYHLVTSAFLEYQQNGDERSARIARLHQSQIVGKIITRQKNTISKGIDLYGWLAPDAVANGSPLLQHIDDIHTARNKIVLHVIQEPNASPSGSLSWVRSGRTDVLSKNIDSGQEIGIYTGMMLPIANLSEEQPCPLPSKATLAGRALLHSGIIPHKLPTQSETTNFIPNERTVVLVVGAHSIQEWLGDQAPDSPFGGIALKLTEHIEQHGLSNKLPNLAAYI